MCKVQYAVYSVQCAVCSVQCAVCYVKCAVCSTVQCSPSEVLFLRKLWLQGDTGETLAAEESPHLDITMGHVTWDM